MTDELLDEPVLMNRLIANVVGMLQDRANAENLLVTSLVGTFPPHLYGDPTRLRQALLNYAGNAIKFTDAGAVHLRAEVAKESDDSVLVRFEVQDTGIGIAPEELSRLFHVFEQVDNTTSRRYGGTGLGLAINKMLAQAMGGEAGASSTLGVGSIFWFTARLRKGPPVVPAESEVFAPNAANILRTDFQNKRVLLVDDDAINREIGSIILQDVGFTVDFAEDGRIAVALVEQRHYDLILMDMLMPRLDGLGATRAIRRLPNGLSVPILAMTANAFAEDRALCLQSGMNDFITKPFELQVLYAAIFSWMKADQTVKALVFDDGQLTLPIKGVMRIERALDIWRDAERYKSFLRKFMNDYERCVDDMRGADPSSVMARAHKLRGAAGSLVLEEIAAAAQRVENALSAQSEPTDAFNALQTAIDAAFVEIRLYVNQTPAVQSEPQAPTDSVALRPILTRILSGLEEESPSQVEPSLKSLRLIVSQEDFLPLAIALENFDFDDCKHVVHALAAKHNISFGN